MGIPTDSEVFTMKALTLVIGLVMLAIGISGFIPSLNPDGVLFGILPMDFVRSVLFTITGAVGVIIGLSRRRELVPLRSASENDLRRWK